MYVLPIAQLLWEGLTNNQLTPPVVWYTSLNLDVLKLVSAHFNYRFTISILKFTILAKNQR